jgi:hypothetical protein
MCGLGPLAHSLVNSPTQSSAHSLSHSLSHPLNPQHTHSPTHSLFRTFTLPPTQPSTHSLSHPFILPQIHSPTLPLAQPSTHSLSHPLTLPHTYSPTHSTININTVPHTHSPTHSVLSTPTPHWLRRTLTSHSHHFTDSSTVLYYHTIGTDEWLLIRKVPSSKLFTEIGYPDWWFSWFLLVSPGILGHDRFLTNIFQFIIHETSYHIALYSPGVFRDTGHRNTDHTPNYVTFMIISHQMI